MEIADALDRHISQTLSSLQEPYMPSRASASRICRPWAFRGRSLGEWSNTIDLIVEFARRSNDDLVYAMISHNDELQLSV